VRHGLRFHERRVSVEDEDVAREAAKFRFRLLDRMRGAQLLLLDDHLPGPCIDQPLDLLAAASDDNDLPGRPKSFDDAEQMVQHRPPAMGWSTL
jgi:hypothetical protein